MFVDHGCNRYAKSSEQDENAILDHLLGRAGQNSDVRPNSDVRQGRSVSLNVDEGNSSMACTHESAFDDTHRMILAFPGKIG